MSLRQWLTIIVAIGNQSQAFDEIYQKVLEEGSINGGELDRLVAKIDFEQTFPGFDQNILDSFLRHGNEQGKRHRLNSEVLDDFLLITRIEFNRRGKLGQEPFPSQQVSCMIKLNSILSKR